MGRLRIFCVRDGGYAAFSIVFLSPGANVSAGIPGGRPLLPPHDSHPAVLTLRSRRTIAPAARLYGELRLPSGALRCPAAPPGESRSALPKTRRVPDVYAGRGEPVFFLKRRS
ncbi:hypothetical protein [Methanoculleus sp. UBA303]|uniref:hypothetical protein n=1 Tax=Methanoculleus sp. UBA303 TaxID=1915497 RepID=UPI0025FB85EC|nr:hypothetical protein [Methanoculleus sp. UBA303]